MYIIYRRGQGGATIECAMPNTSDAIGNSHRGQIGAIIESLTSDASDTIRDSHRGQFRASIESIVSYTCHSVDYIIIYYRGWYIRTRNIPIFIVESVYTVVTFVCDFCSLGLIIEIVVQIAYLHTLNN